MVDRSWIAAMALAATSALAFDVSTVANFSEFETALSNSSVASIFISETIVATRSLTVARDVSIFAHDAILDGSALGGTLLVVENGQVLIQGLTMKEGQGDTASYTRIYNKSNTPDVSVAVGGVLAATGAQTLVSLRACTFIAKTNTSAPVAADNATLTLEQCVFERPAASTALPPCDLVLNGVNATLAMTLSDHSTVQVCEQFTDHAQAKVYIADGTCQTVESYKFLGTPIEIDDAVSGTGVYLSSATLNSATSSECTSCAFDAACSQLSSAWCSLIGATGTCDPRGCATGTYRGFDGCKTCTPYKSLYGNKCEHCHSVGAAELCFEGVQVCRNGSVTECEVSRCVSSAFPDILANALDATIGTCSDAFDESSALLLLGAGVAAALVAVALIVVGVVWFWIRCNGRKGV